MGGERDYGMREEGKRRGQVMDSRAKLEAAQERVSDAGFITDAEGPA